VFDRKRIRNKLLRRIKGVGESVGSFFNSIGKDSLIDLRLRKLINLS
jgi:hypothetical protein